MSNSCLLSQNCHQLTGRKPSGLSPAILIGAPNLVDKKNQTKQAYKAEFVWTELNRLGEQVSNENLSPIT